VFNGDAAVPAFAVDIEDSNNHLVLTSASLSCNGDCIDVQAVPQGGNPPVTYKWSDGSTSATRHLCPTQAATVSVSVEDTASNAGEISYAGQTAMATLAINCMDGGAPDAGTAGACIMNPSFEGTVSSSFGLNFNAPPWAPCGLFNASIGNASTSSVVLKAPNPTDGQTYLGLHAVHALNISANVSQQLCEPLHAGTTYSLKIDLYSPNESSDLGGFSPAALVLLGSSSSCGMGQQLWTSPTAGPSWKTYCATFTPPVDLPYLQLASALEADASDVSSELFVDHIVPVASCQ
jgi:hypothetical protein